MLSCKITRCQFVNNISPYTTERGGKGGAIFVNTVVVNNGPYLRNLESGENPFEIVECKFEGNSAFMGGAIYSVNQAIRIENCIFESNNAVSGGAIATEIKNPNHKISIISSEFNNNIAELYGGTVLALEAPAFEFDDASTFNNNFETFETGVPYLLRLQVYKLNEEQKFLSEEELANSILEDEIVRYGEY